jgi:hypothetical protein
MKNFIYLVLILTLWSCGSDNTETENSLLGTWVLSEVSGDCVGLPISGQGTALGCIPIPTLEINCMILELQPNGVLSYTVNGDILTGSYMVENDSEVSLCFPKCIVGTISGPRISLNTGTVPQCDPFYTFLKSTETLDEILTSNQNRTLKQINVNGRTHSTYSYYTDGNIQSIQYFNDEGDLNANYTYAYEPLKVTNQRTFFNANGFTYTNEYYNESFNRLRRDRIGSDGELEKYDLFFISSSACWIDRREIYDVDNNLDVLQNYTYNATDCGFESSSFKEGSLDYKLIVEVDNNPKFNQSVDLDILNIPNTGNILSFTYIEDNEVTTNSSFTSTFTYEDSGYPSGETRIFLNGTVNVYSYIYE